MSGNRSIELVVHRDGEMVMLWPSNGECIIANDVPALARQLVALARDENVPAVSTGPATGRGYAIAKRFLDRLAPDGGSVPREQLVAVHVVVMVSVGDDPFTGALWPPKGPPRMAASPTRLAKLLLELAGDESMPRVPAGGPPEPMMDLVERGLSVVADHLPARAEGG